MRHETSIFGPNKPKPEIPVIILLPCLFQQQKPQTLAETPIL